MTLGDVLGWAACVMTLVTFIHRRRIRLRAAALLANPFFIGHAALGHHLPVLALHLTLLPVSGQRLFLLHVERSHRRAAGLLMESCS